MGNEHRAHKKNKSLVYRSLSLRPSSLVTLLLACQAMAWTPGPIATAEQWLSTLTEPELLSSPVEPSVAGDFDYLAPAAQGRRVGLNGFRTAILAPRMGSAVFEVRSVTELNATIQRMRSQRLSGSVRVYPGTYLFTNSEPLVPALNLSFLQDVVIEAANPKQRPLLAFSNPTASGIYIKNSKRLRISNLDIDYRYPSSYGRVAYNAKALGGQTIQVVQAGSFQRPDQVTDLFSFNRLTGAYFNQNPPKRIHTESLSTPPTYNFENATITHPSISRFNIINEPVIAMHSREGYANAVHVTGPDTEDVTIEGLHLFSYPQMGIRVEAIKRGAWIKDNIIEPRPGVSPFVSGRADGIHISGANDTAVERNIIRNIGDDCLNIRSSDLPVLEARLVKDVNGNIDPLASSITVEKNQGADIAATGDFVALLSNTHRPLHLMRVVSGSENQVVLNQLDWGNCNSQCVDNLVAILAARTPDGRRGILYNLSRSASRHVVHYNECSYTASRGMLLQAPNGRVRKNTIQHAAGACILAVAENAAFTAGPGPSNVGIFSNTIDDCTRQDLSSGPQGEPERNAAIGVTTPSLNEAFPLIQQLLIRLNTIRNIPRSGVGISRARNIEITDNNFESVATLPGTPLFRVAPTASVFIRQNTIR